MRPNLSKPLIVFDLETTGLDISRDRIIQLSYIKVMPDGSEQRKMLLVNPEREIPQAVIDLTHITNEMVSGSPTFKEFATGLSKEFEGCDFAGYNSNHFDIPLLAEEFLRAGVNFDFSRCRMIDVATIFCRMERRNLAAAYKFYCGRKMEDDFQAHRADEDTEATWRVLQGQLDMYAPGRQEEPERVLHNDINELHELSRQADIIDFAGRLIWKELTGKDGKPLTGADGKPVMKEAFNFGKYKGMFVTDVLRRDPGYYSWMMNGDFPQNTKQILTRIRMKTLSNKSAVSNEQ